MSKTKQQENKKQDKVESILTPIGEQKELSVDIHSSIVVSMTPEVHYELMRYVMHYKTTEVEGFGSIEKIEHSDYVEFSITGLHLPTEQDNSAAYTETIEDHIHDMLVDFARRGVDTDNLRLHWHSHANMSTFHSATDKENYETMLKQDYLVSLVANRNGDILAGVHFAKPFRVDFVGVPLHMVTNTVISADNDNRITNKLEKLDKYLEKNKFVALQRNQNGYMHNYKGKKRKGKAKQIEDLSIVDVYSSNLPKKTEPLLEEVERLEALLASYTDIEKTKYGTCLSLYDEHTQGNHDCGNPKECLEYNKIVEKLKVAEDKYYTSL